MINMDKKTKGIVVFIVLIIIGIGAYLAYLYINEEKVQNEQNVVVQQNNSNKNEISENEVEEEEEEPETVVDNSEENNELENETTPEPASNNSEVTYANDNEKAIEIAKKAWGDTDGVYFSNQGMKANGDYIVAVSSNATVLAYYYVNVSNETYTVEYN